MGCRSDHHRTQSAVVVSHRLWQRPEHPRRGRFGHPWRYGDRVRIGVTMGVPRGRGDRFGAWSPLALTHLIGRRGFGRSRRGSASAVTTKAARVGHAACEAAAPASAFLGTDSGSFSALRGENFRVAGVRVAPPQVGVEPPGEHDVVRVARVVEHELAQRPEVGFDRVGPRAVGRCEAELDSGVVSPTHGSWGPYGRTGCPGSRRSSGRRGARPGSIAPRRAR